MPARIAALATVVTVSLACLTALRAQDYSSPYRSPAPVGTYDPPPARFMDHRSTELGDALDALSLVIEARGRAQRNFSEALINVQTAERLRLANLAERERVLAEIEKARTEQTILRYERRRIAHQQLAESRAMLKPPVVLGRQGEVLWISPLRSASYRDHRELIEGLIDDLRRAETLEERELAVDSIGITCGELLEAIDARQQELSPSAYDASRRFVHRFLEDVRQIDLDAGSQLTRR